MRRDRDIEWSSNRSAVRTRTLRASEDSSNPQEVPEFVQLFVRHSRRLLPALKTTSSPSAPALLYAFFGNGGAKFSKFLRSAHVFVFVSHLRTKNSFQPTAKRAAKYAQQPSCQR